MHVFGHEHYAENLEDLACAGVPIHHPISGKTVGAVDLTCWRKDAGPAAAHARQDHRRADPAGPADRQRHARELELLQEYLRTCRRTAGIVFAAQQRRGDDERPRPAGARPGRPVGAAGAGRRDPWPAATRRCVVGAAQRRQGPDVLPPGARRRTGSPAASCTSSSPSSACGRSAETATAPRMFLPGLVGSGALWLRACHQVDSGSDAGEWLALEGEPGVGQAGRAPRRAPAAATRPAASRCSTRPPPPGMPAGSTDARRELLGEGAAPWSSSTSTSSTPAAAGPVRRSPGGAGRARRAPAVGGGDAGPATTTASELAELLRFFPSTVELPPLRHHIEDVQALVPFFLARLATAAGWSARRRRCSCCCAVELAGQHRAALAGAAAGSCSTGAAASSSRTTCRRSAVRSAARLLSPLESMERDAIVQA